MSSSPPPPPAAGGANEFGAESKSSFRPPPPPPNYKTQHQINNLKLHVNDLNVIKKVILNTFGV
jgi:hypothetical protein